MPYIWKYALSNHGEIFSQFGRFKGNIGANCFRNREGLGTKPKLRSLVRVPQTRTRLYVSRSFLRLAHRCHVIFCCLVAAKGKWLAELFCSLLYFVVYYSKLVTEFSDNRRDYFCDRQDPQVKSSVKENKAKCQFLNALYELAFLKLT